MDRLARRVSQAATGGDEDTNREADPAFSGHGGLGTGVAPCPAMPRLLAAALLFAACSPPAEPLPPQAPASRMDGAPVEEGGVEAAVELPAPPTPPSVETPPPVAAPPTPPAPVPNEPEVVDEEWDEGISVLARMDASERPVRRRANRFSSSRMQEALALRAPVRRGRRMTRRDRYSTWGVESFRLGSDAWPTQICGAVEIELHPHPMDFVYYCEAEPASTVEAAAFDPQEGASTGVADELVARLTALRTAQPGLLVFRVRAGWADAVGAAAEGIAVLDPTTREMLWLYSLESWDV